MVTISSDFMGIQHRRNLCFNTLNPSSSLPVCPKYLFEAMLILELNLEVCRLERTCLRSWPSSTLARSCVLGCSIDLHPLFWYHCSTLVSLGR